MIFQQGEFYLIKDYSKYKANQYIGKIIDRMESNLYLISIYLFPEDTECGKQPYMSSFEVFPTATQSIHEFKEDEIKKVEVEILENYINKKYINSEKLKFPLYFWRQSYNLEINGFNPEKLPLFCYCQEIFNPDIPFKKCICGNYFHPDCLLQSVSGKCWSKNCNYDCNNFLSEEEKIQKALILSDIKTAILREKQAKTNNFLNKKANREAEMNGNENDNRKKFKIITFQEHNRNDNRSTIPKKENSRNIEIIEVKTKGNNIDRDKGIKKIYNVLVSVLDNINNNLDTINKYQYCKNIEIYNLIKEGQGKDNVILLFQLKILSENIEKYLFEEYKNKPSSYYNFIQEFNKCKTTSIDLIIKIIFGEYTPNQVSQFKGDDFLSEEKKKEKEEKKKSEINKMILKNDEEGIKLTLNKGRMLSEKEIFYEDENKNNNLYIRNETEKDELFENNEEKEYKKKLKEKQMEFPHLDSEDVKLMINLRNPDENYIKVKLNKLIQENLEINEQDEFFEKRKIFLEKEAKKIMKNNKKNNLNLTQENFESKNNLNEEENIQNIIKNISIDIKFF